MLPKPISIHASFSCLCSAIQRISGDSANPLGDSRARDFSGGGLRSFFSFFKGRYFPCLSSSHERVCLGDFWSSGGEVPVLICWDECVFFVSFLFLGWCLCCGRIEVFFWFSLLSPPLLPLPKSRMTRGSVVAGRTSAVILCHPEETLPSAENPFPLSSIPPV